MPFAPSGPNDGVTYRKTESGAVTLVGSPMEPVKQSGPLFDRDAGPVVLDHQAHPMALRADRDYHHSPVSGVAAGIVHEDGGEAVDPFGRCVDPWLPLTLCAHRKRNTALLGDSVKPVGTRHGDRQEVYRLVSGRRRFGIKTGKPEEVLDDEAEAQGLPAHPSQRVAVVLDAAATAETQTDLGLNDAERCPELVGCVGRELELTAADSSTGPAALIPMSMVPKKTARRSTGPAISSRATTSDAA